MRPNRTQLARINAHFVQLHHRLDLLLTAKQFCNFRLVARNFGATVLNALPLPLDFTGKPGLLVNQPFERAWRPSQHEEMLWGAAPLVFCNSYRLA